MSRRLLRPALLLFILLIMVPSSAGAHANFVSSNIEPNAVLEIVPVQVEIFFTEPIEDGFSTIQVIDSTGKRVDNDDSRVDPNDPTRMTVSLRSLLDGVYTVSWKTLSSVDSHITAGAFPFAVGDVDAAALAAAQTTQQTQLSPGEVIFRWVQYLSAAALTGIVIFRQLVWSPGLRAARKDEDPLLRTPWKNLAIISVIVFVVGNAFGLLAQIGQVGGTFFAAPWNATTNQILFATRYGSLWIIRISAAILMLWLLLKYKTPWQRWGAFALSLGILLDISLGSHAAAEPRMFWPVLGDWLHLVSVSVWVGGLISFVFALSKTPGLSDVEDFRRRLVAQLVPRFSKLALISVAILGISGVYSAVLRVGSWDALFNELYGRTLITKTLLAVPLIGLGAVNLLILSPRLRREKAGTAATADAFKRVVSWEVILSAVVLLAVGIFTILPPVRATTTTATLQGTRRADDLEITVDVDPGEVGKNTFTVELTSDGVPVEDAKEVFLRFTPTTVDLPTLETPLTNIGGGVYSAEGSYMALPDSWQLQTVVRRESVFDVFANFEFSVGDSATTQTFPWNRLAAFVLLIGGGGILLISRVIPMPGKRRLYLGQLPALLLVAAGVATFYRPPDNAERLINPIPPNAGSVAIGKSLYLESCLQCHGPTGKGDGPVGLTLIPKPADLTLHTVPGVHPDSQLFEWISFGVPGSPMPIFEQIYSTEERWHLVNYIRTFSPEE